MAISRKRVGILVSVLTLLFVFSPGAQAWNAKVKKAADADLRRVEVAAKRVTDISEKIAKLREEKKTVPEDLERDQQAVWQTYQDVSEAVRARLTEQQGKLKSDPRSAKGVRNYQKYIDKIDEIAGGMNDDPAVLEAGAGNVETDNTDILSRYGVTEEALREYEFDSIFYVQVVESLKESERAKADDFQQRFNGDLYGRIQDEDEGMAAVRRWEQETLKKYEKYLAFEDAVEGRGYSQDDLNNKLAMLEDQEWGFWDENAITQEPGNQLHNNPNLKEIEENGHAVLAAGRDVINQLRDVRDLSAETGSSPTAAYQQQIDAVKVRMSRIYRHCIEIGAFQNN